MMWTSLIMATGAIVCMWIVDAKARGPRRGRVKDTA
ncbi:MAG: hypothetical protein ETSY2_44290 [Candidatus Entotheonella gemina]|uniref:Uncharacterized protein n=1 Tax=Candidatus Entotheonella gemina TaxID=1429439 RepID=W4LIT4_9BACT|nr:MAG: hypothetical protein ETSY2_44290 [Candidatus Entotheonella gemina]